MADKNDIVIIELDRPRMLWFGHKALKTLTALTGKKLEDFETAFQDMDFELLEKVLYCGLLTDAKANNEVLKLEEMEDLLDKAPFPSHDHEVHHYPLSVFSLTTKCSNKSLLHFLC